MLDVENRFAGSVGIAAQHHARAACLDDHHADAVSDDVLQLAADPRALRDDRRGLARLLLDRGLRRELAKRGGTPTALPHHTPGDPAGEDQQADVEEGVADRVEPARRSPGTRQQGDSHQRWQREQQRDNAAAGVEPGTRRVAEREHWHDGAAQVVQDFAAKQGLDRRYRNAEHQRDARYSTADGDRRGEEHGRDGGGEPVGLGDAATQPRLELELDDHRQREDRIDAHRVEPRHALAQRSHATSSRTSGSRARTVKPPPALAPA